MKRAEVIRKLIDETGLNTKAFAEKAGLPYTTLRSMLERGMSKSAVENVIKVCGELGITIEEMEQMASRDIHTIAAHHDGEDWTEEELEEIERFKEFVRSKRQNK